MTTKDRLNKHDKQIAAIRNLVQRGMELVVQSRKDIRSLTAAQKRTDASLKTLIDSMRGGGNGHSKVKVDLQ